MSVWTVGLIVTGTIALVAVLRPLLRTSDAWDVDERTELDHLFESKARALRVLKDLDHEHRAGLLSDADWAAARRDSVADAVRLNREIAARTGIDAPAVEAEEAEELVP